MLSYLTDAMRRFNNATTRKLQDQPYPHIKPNYGAKEQYTEEDDAL